MDTQILTHQSAVPAEALTPCGGRTWFDAIVQGWHDQGRMREHMEGLHAIELDRVKAETEIHTITDVSRPLVTVNPDARTVVFSVSGPARPASSESQTEEFTAIFPDPDIPNWVNGR